MIINYELSVTLINKLYNLSSQALRLVAGDDYSFFSFDDLHVMFNRATPEKWSNYIHANHLYNIINNQKPITMWTDLQPKLTVNNRTNHFTIERTNLTKFGLNNFTNRLRPVENEINFTLLT